jgi:nucleoside-diphosphate-sugar epimerase
LASAVNSNVLQKITHVIHLADPRLEQFKSADDVKINVNTQKIFIYSLAGLPHLKKIIFASSCSVYGANKNQINESSEPQPTSWYAESKLQTEALFKASALPHVICRFGTAYGPSENMRHDLFINNLCRAANLKQRIDIYGANAWRPYIHVRDFSRALMFVLNNEVP